MPFDSKSVTDPTFLSAALEGLELQKQRIEEQIAMVRSLLGQQGGRSTAAKSKGAATKSEPSVAPLSSSKPSKKRVLSASARKRIAEAQKKRWAEFRKKSK